MLEVLVAVELLVVGVGDGIEFRLILWCEHGLGVAPEVGTGHGDDVCLAARNELTQVRTQLVVGIGRNVVKLVDGDQTVVERLDTVGINREAEGGVGADQHLVVAVEECAQRLNLAAIVVARRVAKVPLGFDLPVGPEAVLRQQLVVEAGTDGLLGHDDDGLLNALILELVECHEHQRTALARRGRRLDEQVLLAAFLVGAFLHGPHSKRIGLSRCAVAGVGNGNGRYGLDLVAHGLAPALRFLPLAGAPEAVISV